MRAKNSGALVASPEFEVLGAVDGRKWDVVVFEDDDGWSEKTE